MRLITLSVGPLAANCYLVACERTGEAAVVDPGGDAPRILAAARDNGLRPLYVINTHGHLDHIAANGEVAAATGAAILIHQDDARMLTSPEHNLSAFTGDELVVSPAAQRLLGHGDLIKVGDVSLKVLHTPGHTPGSICLHAGNTLLAGDTLFAGSVGRTDLPGGSMAALVRSIHEVILPLADETIVYPGHGPHTTIGEERRTNPFF